MRYYIMRDYILYFETYRLFAHIANSRNPNEIK